VGASQGEAIHTMLADVLVQFSDQIHAMFGGQMNGVSELLTKTTSAMEQTAARFDRLAASVESAGRNTTDAMTGKIESSLAAMEERQQELNRQTSEFAEQLKAVVTHAQREGAEKLQQSMATLGEQVVGVVGQIHDQARMSGERQRDEGTRFLDQTETMVGGLSREIENLLRQSSETTLGLRDTVAALAESTRDSVTRMNSGAELLYGASTDFARAGQSVAATIQGASGAMDRIQLATQSLSNAMNGTIEILDEYKKSRDAFAMMVTDLKATIQNAKKEAAMTSELVKQMEGAALQLGKAEKLSQDYLAGVNEVLTRTHEAFAANLERTLSHGNARFHVELSKAVDLLATGIRDLENVIELVPARG
ncbi:MAG: hypothetical protein QOJ51_6013, partial [Acidobacteriaceae bacterium]|nr:hypothetical protein [Acidobacteriaceae bacterium]